MNNKKIYSQNLKDLMKIFQTGENGLKSTQLEKLTKKYGKNLLIEKKKKNLFKIFLEQFKDFLVIILLIAAVISFISGNRESTFVILIVLSINAILGTIQQLKAEKSLDSLKKISSPKATVLRDGCKIDIDSCDVLPGDIIYVEAGNIIPTDARVIKSFSLMVDESSLTGESESVEKISEEMPNEELSLGDQKNMVFSGSLVTYGRGVLLATNIGMKTELGKIATLLDKTKNTMTPLQKSLEIFGKKLSFVIIILCIIIFFIGISRGINTLDSLMFAVALAVAAIPEALGSIVTIVLAIGTQKLAKENGIVKKLHSVESLGCVSIICSDKTGTLTQNKMKVKNLFVDTKTIKIENFNKNSYLEQKIIELAILCNDATISNKIEFGDPTELALIKLNKYLNKNSDIRQQFNRLKELPFDSDRKMMSTLHKFEDKYFMITKGAPDVILDKSRYILKENENIDKLDSETLNKIKTANNQFSQNGLRVLAFAIKQITNKRDLSFDDEKDFIFVGLISMIDPPRVESKKAVAECVKAGIKPVMITGDYKTTAKAIAKQIGIYKEGDYCLNGIEIENMTDEQLMKSIPYVSVYARVSPEHKIRIVSAWQKLGKICAMTGDGVNDAPALKKADIGIAMGITGTQVSKDAADLILTDDNFSTIVKSIITGRNLYLNIKNSIQFLLSGNMAGILAVFYSSLMGLPMIFAPVHLLFINLLTDSLPAIAIGMEPPHSDVLSEKPRDANSSLLDKTLAGKVFFEGLLIAIFTIIAFYIGLNKQNIGLATTMAFSTLCLARLLHGFNCRGNDSIFKLGFKSNMFSIYAFILGVLFLYSVLLFPIFHSMFVITKLSIVDFIEINILAFIPTIIIQIAKFIKSKR